MPRHDGVSTNSRKRILDNVRDRLSVEVPQAPGRPAPAQPAATARPPKKPSKAKPKAPKKPDSLATMAIMKLVVLALVIIAGVTVIFWLRDLGEAFGINWIGD